MKNISLKQIRAFIAVAELGKFRLAAEHIGVTQSAISVLIKELEYQLGVVLFDRHTRMVGLTFAGETFLPLARRISGQVEDAVQAMDDLATLRSGRVSVASAIVLASTLVPEVIAEFKRTHPDVEVSLTDVSEQRIRDLLIDGEVDIGIGTSRKIEANIREHRLFSDRLAVFFHKEHEFRKRKVLKWTDLEGQDIVGFASDSPIQTIVDRVLNNNEINTRLAFSVSFSTTMLSLVNQGLGICIAPEHSHRLSVPTETELRPLVEPEIRREIVALTLREHMPSPSARSFLDLLLSRASRQK
ncbi:LysR family transcriptional regulator [Oceanibium sediminis]|uniref:LysR family transcriptional regulator n=1 Tax=Oceanibium sediminis TaxID=2026339 RepID=UPI000DD2FF38|nr:LysR family transcriptional regulator [Oceanibium sediminis]